MTAARVIAGFAADLRLDDVPPVVREAACLHLIDAIGVVSALLRLRRFCHFILDFGRTDT